MDTPEERLEALVDGADPIEAMLAMTKWLFIKTAEIDGTLTAQTQMLGLIAGRLGIAGDDLRKRIDDREGDFWHG
jgi:hypothetical protein